MKILFFDTETEQGLFGRNRLTQLKWYGEDEVMLFERDTLSAKEIMKEADLIVVHNAFYDFNCNEFIGFDFKADIFDTRLAAIYDKPCAKKFDLNSCLKRYDIGYKEDLGKSDWSGTLTEEQIEYAKQDVILLEKLYDKLKHIGKIPAFKLDMKNYKYAVKYSHNGFPVIEENRLKFLEKYKAKEKELIAKLPKGLNVNSPKQVTEFLGIEKSDKETLVDLEDERAKLILELRDTQKKISTLEKKFAFDRVKGIFKPAQAKSGRWTCSKREAKNPQYQNLQQIDRDLKQVFGVTEDDLYLVDADFSSLEMFTAAAVFRSEKMMRLLHEGRDLHKYTASMVFGKPESEISKQERQISKGLNFGTLYGAGVDVVSIFIQTYTGNKLPREDVAKFRRRWLETYSDIKTYHYRMGSKFTGKQLIVRTPLGRPICATSYTEAINTPAQGFGAEITKTAIHLLMKAYPQAKIVNTVHDSITLEVRGFEEAKKVACILKDSMDEAWRICKKFIKTPPEILKVLEMDNTAEVVKTYEGEVLWTTEL